MHPKAHHPIEINIHDTTQIEVKTIHHVPAELNDEEVLFNQEMYLFLPASLGINKNSYDKETFYKSMTNYIRVKTPQLLDADERENCRLDRLMPTLWKAYTLKLRPSSFDEAMREIKIFGAYMNDLLKNSSRHNADEALEITNHFCALLKNYRELMDFEEDIIQSEPWTTLERAMESIDEFLSHRLEEILVRNKVTGFDVSAAMNNEFSRRHKMGYLSLNETTKTGIELQRLREEYNFLMGQLKKFTSEVLYLEVKRFKPDRMYVHISAALGAAIAAFGSFMLNPFVQASPSKSFLSTLSLSLPTMVTVITLIYIFQDRTKDAIRDYILQRFRPWIPDYRNDIKQANVGLIAKCNEQMQHLAFSEVPELIKKIRQHQLPRHPFGSDTENVLLYSRRVKINRKSLSKIFRNANTIKDILRYDVHPFLTRMGTPVRPENFFSSDLKVTSIDMPKVYHVNLVVVHKTLNSRKKILSQEAVRVRLIIDKEGIQRIESVDLS